MSPQEITSFLQSTPLFATDPAAAATVAPLFKPFEYPPSGTIFRAGTPATIVGILVGGKAKVMSVNASTGQGTVVETVAPGDLIGEVGALIAGAHSHSVVAESACSVLQLDRAALEQLCLRMPGLGHTLSKRLAMKVVKLSVMGMRPPSSDIPSASPATLTQQEGVIPFCEVSDFNPTANVLAMIPLRLMREHRVLPLHMHDRTLTIGMVAPRNMAAIAGIKRVLQSVDLEVVAISQDDFVRTVARLKPSKGQADGNARAGIGPDQLAFDVDDAEREAEKEIRVIGDEVVRWVNRIIAEGLDREASDIHVEPDRTGVLVRYRINGVLEDWSDMVPASFGKGIIARMKVLAGLDITERRLPQDGRLGLTVARREVDLRVSTVPAARGEKIVLRVCEAASMLRPLEQTFLSGPSLKAVRRALHLPAGAIIVAGGTGSGKSSTLYSMLAERQKVRPDSNVVMVEDPIEYRLQGATQIQVNTAVGLGFAEVLRATLRQDPDVIVVGETRDKETSHLALEAAISGHLLLTSLHANDAIATLQRLESLGTPRSLIAQSLSLVVVQRLAQRLCTQCVQMSPPPPILADALAEQGMAERSAPAPVPTPVGCVACGQTGYAGRVAVIECLRIDDELRGMLMAERSLNDVQQMAEERDLLISYKQCASFLMNRKLLSAADALMATSH